MNELIEASEYGARLKSVEVIGAYSVRVTFSDGVVYEKDLSRWFTGPKGGPLGSPEDFARVQVHEKSDTLLWENDFHVHGEMLHDDFLSARTRR